MKLLFQILTLNLSNIMLMEVTIKVLLITLIKNPFTLKSGPRYVKIILFN